jgi:hypothetical protein
MLSTEIRGVGRISFNGVVHGLDRHGTPYCGSVGGTTYLWDDHWYRDWGEIIQRITCKRCLSRYDREIPF